MTQPNPNSSLRKKERKPKKMKMWAVCFRYNNVCLQGTDMRCFHTRKEAKAYTIERYGNLVDDFHFVRVEIKPV